jgi:hypothetical protein
MDKRWLSQLCNDSAYPLLALALVVSQVNLGSDRKANLLGRERHPVELKFKERWQGNSGEHASSTPQERSRGVKITMSNNESVQH